MRNKQATEAQTSHALKVARDATPLEHTLSAWGTRNPPHEGVLAGDGDAVAHGDEAEGQDVATQTSPQRLRAHPALSRPRTWKSANTTGLKKDAVARQGPTNTLEGRKAPKTAKNDNAWHDFVDLANKFLCLGRYL